MDIVDIIGYALEAKHNPVVKEEFEESWNDSNFERCDVGSLLFILDAINNFIKSSAISDFVKHEIREYKEDLLSYNPLVEYGFKPPTR